MPKTNNLIELLFRTTFPGKIKRIYITYEGAINKIKLNNIRWFERIVIQNYSKAWKISEIFYSIHNNHNITTIAMNVIYKEQSL